MMKKEEGKEINLPLFHYVSLHDEKEEGKETKLHERSRMSVSRKRDRGSDNASGNNCHNSDDI